ncbi:hypothetical protein SNK03_013064 [Fusarium graminearum]
MKVTTLLIAALTTLGAAATPVKKCTPGTYSCTPDTKGWRVCDVTHTWVFAGVCPPKTGCLFNTKNGSPYCVPPGFHF